MSSLATKLRNAVATVLVVHDAKVSDNGIFVLTDDDFAFLNTCSTFAQMREAGLSGGDATAKLDQYAAVTTGPLPGETGAPITLHTDAPSAAIPAAGAGIPAAATLSPSDQAALPLGDADRGPEPQDAGTLISTAAPLDGVNQDQQPPDYTRLSTMKG